MTQNEAILDYLKSGHSITPKDAYLKFACLRLAARIKDLRDDGHKIHREMVTIEDATFAKYWMEPSVYPDDFDWRDTVNV